MLLNHTKSSIHSALVNIDWFENIHEKMHMFKNGHFFVGEFICNKTTVGEPSKVSGISIDVSSDARFFVATGVLSILYCVFITAVYTVIDEIYQSKPEVPLAVNTNLIWMNSKKNVFSLNLNQCYLFYRISCWQPYWQYFGYPAQRLGRMVPVHWRR